METAKVNDSDALVALRYQAQDMTEKLNEQKQSLDRERQLLASGRRIYETSSGLGIFTIIDVYDTDPEGRTKTSFARAFYTEGKSLIFYATTFPQKRTEEGKFVYSAWGEKNGDKKKVRNLGILLNDDKGQKRWVLNFLGSQRCWRRSIRYLSRWSASERMGMDPAESAFLRLTSQASQIIRSL